MKDTERPHVIRGIELLKDRLGKKISICLTGMRPSGRLHLGHYKGALENRVKMQELENIKNYFLVADYQVLGDHLGQTEQMRQSVVDMVIDRLAVGIDPEKSNIIIQSYVPEFAELFNFLTMFVPYAVAVNNPTLKDEISKINDRNTNNVVSLGFVNYPVSQVADIMLPRGDLIPVGEDQIPHIELARKIIKKINAMYGTDYALPVALISETPRLVGIDGNNKMSKSLGNVIEITASLEEIKQKVNKMYTDSGKVSVKSPGNIQDHVVFKYLDVFYKDKEHLEELKKRYIEGGENSIGDGELKKILINVLDELLAPIREKREYYKNHMDIVIRAMEEGSARLRQDAAVMLNELKQAMGLLNYGK